MTEDDDKLYRDGGTGVDDLAKAVYRFPPEGPIHKSDFMCACSPEQREISEACFQRVLDEVSFRAVHATVYHYGGGESREVGTILVQCDLVEHGVARVWELAKEIVAEDERRSDVAVAEEEAGAGGDADAAGAGGEQGDEHGRDGVLDGGDADARPGGTGETDQGGAG
jgi:hypothetical protein